MPDETASDAAKEQTPVLECPLSFVLREKDGKPGIPREAKARLGADGLALLPRGRESIFLSYRDILGIDKTDYSVTLSLLSGETISLSELGYRFEDFIRLLHRFRNETLLADLLMKEPILRPDVGAEYRRLDASGKEIGGGRGKIRVYQTSLVLIPEKGEFERFYLSDIDAVEAADYVLTITAEREDKIVLSQMGSEIDSLERVLNGQIGELFIKAQSLLKGFSPGLSPDLVRRAARLVKEGRGAKRADLEAVSPSIWRGLESGLASQGLKEEFDFLKPMARNENIRLGWKRGLSGGPEADYVWFLIPLYGQGSGRPGNAAVWEATTGEEEEGRATYFFRLLDRDEFSKTSAIADLDRAVDESLNRMILGLRAVNFRREPIYLPDERLEEPRFVHDRFAAAGIPSLQTLRRRFIGRVIHSSKEQWEKDVMDLLAFNASAPDEAVRWVRSEAKPEGTGD